MIAPLLAALVMHAPPLRQDCGRVIVELTDTEHPHVSFSHKNSDIGAERNVGIILQKSGIPGALRDNHRR